MNNHIFKGCKAFSYIKLSLSGVETFIMVINSEGQGPVWKPRVRISGIPNSRDATSSKLHNFDVKRDKLFQFF